MGRAEPAGTAWPAGDLRSRLARTLDLAADVVGEFGRTGYQDDGAPELGFGPDKVVAETAMLVYAASGSTTDPDVVTRVEALIDLVAPLCRSPRALIDMALHPARAPKYAVPHVLLSALGSRDPAFDDFMIEICDAARGFAADSTPCARMEQRWIRSVWGRPSDGDRDIRGTIADRPLDALGACREDIYAVTHLVFYLSDFGRSDPVELARTRTEILADVRAAVVRCLHAEDYDLAAELLVAWPAFGATWGAVPSFCFRVLATVEDAVGVLPCGNIDHVRLAAMAPPDRSRYVKATGYHTAYVMGLLCALALRRTAPSAHAAGPAEPGTAWQEFHDLVDTRQGHWLPIFEALPEAERPALTAMVADFAVLQALERHDYARARKALLLAGEAGISGPIQAGAASRLMSLGAAMTLGAHVPAGATAGC